MQGEILLLEQSPDKKALQLNWFPQSHIVKGLSIYRICLKFQDFNNPISLSSSISDPILASIELKNLLPEYNGTSLQGLCRQKSLQRNTVGAVRAIQNHTKKPDRAILLQLLNRLVLYKPTDSHDSAKDHHFLHTTTHTPLSQSLQLSVSQV